MNRNRVSFFGAEREAIILGVTALIYLSAKRWKIHLYIFLGSLKIYV